MRVDVRGLARPVLLSGTSQQQCELIACVACLPCGCNSALFPVASAFLLFLSCFFCCVLFLSRCRVCVFWCWCVQQRDCIFLHTSLALSLLYFFKMPYRGNTDLLHPDKAQEAKTHKLKRLVQSPNSFFMDVRCPGCTAM